MSQKPDGSVIIEAKLALDQYKKDLADLERETNKVANNIQAGMEKSAAGTDKLQGSIDSLARSMDAMNASALRSVTIQERLAKIEVSRAVNARAAGGMGKLAAAEALVATNATKAGLSIKSLTAGLKIFLRVLTGLGPVGLATAALSSALGYLAGKQEKTAETSLRYSSIVDDMRAGTESAAAATDKLAEKIAKLSKEQAGVDLRQAKKEYADLREEIESLAVPSWDLSRLFVVDTKPFKEITQQFLDGKIQGEEYRKAIDNIGNSLNKTGRELADTLIDASYRPEALSKEMRALEDTANGLSASTIQLVSAFKKLDEAQKIKNADDAIKTLDLLIQNTDSAKNAAIENKKAKAQEAIQYLRTAAAAAEYAAAMVEVEIQEYSSVGATDKVNAALVRRKELLDAAARATERANKAEATISAPGFKWDSSGTGRAKKDLESLSDYIVRFRKGLDDVRTSGEKTFEKGLGAGVEKLRKDLEKVKGATENVFKSLKKELEVAHAENFLKGLKRDLEELSGRGLIDKMTAQIEDVTQALEKLGPESEDAARLLRGLTLAATDNKPSFEALTAEIDAQAEALIKANPELAEYIRLLAKKAKEEAKEGGEDKALQARLQFLEEYGRLSGNYGKAIELQTKLISERAKALRKEYPDLKANIDGWERLAKLEIDPSFDAGISRSAQKFTAEWTNAGKVAEKTFDTLIGGVQSVGSSAIDAVFGDAEFRIDTLFKDIAKQMMQIAMNQTIAGAMKSLFGVGGEDEIAAIQAKTEAELASIATISAAKTAALNSESAAVATVGEQWTIAQALQELATESTVMGAAQQEMSIAGLAAASTTAIQTETAVSTSAAAETAAAWAPAATTASIGSFGTAAALALVGIMAVMALLRGFSQGGYTGNGSTSDVAGVVHGGEFVVNAAATRSIGVNNLNSLNSTGSLASLSTGRSSALSNLERPQSGGDMYVNVINNASDTTVSQQQSADANGNMRLDIIIDDIMAGKLVNGSSARVLQSAYGLRRTVGRV